MNNSVPSIPREQAKGCRTAMLLLIASSYVAVAAIVGTIQILKWVVNLF